MQSKLTSQIKRARRDSAFFVEFCFPNEKTGKRIFNEDFHREWHDFFNENRWAVLISPIEHGKTVHTSIGRTIWKIGNNPNIRILLLGESDPAAQKTLRLILHHIEKNPKIKLVFPHLKPSSDRKDPWNSSDMVVERDLLLKEPTVQARGANSKNILGSRLDLIVADDILNLENTNTKLARDKLEEWFFMTCFSRVQDEYDLQGNLIEGGEVDIIGTPWNRDDFLHRLKKRKKVWKCKHYRAVLNHNDPESKWRPLWPRIWPVPRLIDKRDAMSITAFARTLLCEVMTDQMRRFKEVWLQNMLKKGENRYFIDQAPRGFGGKLMRCYTGVDIGVGKKRKDAKTVLFTIAICPRTKIRIPVDIESGRWDGPTIVSKIEKKNRRYQSLIFVESNAAQDFINDFVGERGVPTEGLFTSAANKYNEQFGVESLGIEMRANLWLAPSGKDGEEVDPEIDEWFEDMRNYDPELHTGDHLMACWIAREGARLYENEMFGESDHMRR